MAPLLTIRQGPQITARHAREFALLYMEALSGASLRSSDALDGTAARIVALAAEVPSLLGAPTLAKGLKLHKFPSSVCRAI